MSIEKKPGDVGWRTIHGAHVFLGAGGIIIAGPKKMIGKTPDALDGPKAEFTAAGLAEKFPIFSAAETYLFQKQAGGGVGPHTWLKQFAAAKKALGAHMPGGTVDSLHIVAEAIPSVIKHAASITTSHITDYHDLHAEMLAFTKTMSTNPIWLGEQVDGLFKSFEADGLLDHISDDVVMLLFDIGMKAQALAAAVDANAAKAIASSNLAYLQAETITAALDNIKYEVPTWAGISIKDVANLFSAGKLQEAHDLMQSVLDHSKKALAPLSTAHQNLIAGQIAEMRSHAKKTGVNLMTKLGAAPAPATPGPVATADAKLAASAHNGGVVPHASAASVLAANPSLGPAAAYDAYLAAGGEPYGNGKDGKWYHAHKAAKAALGKAAPKAAPKAAVEAPKAAAAPAPSSTITPFPNKQLIKASEIGLHYQNQGATLDEAWAVHWPASNMPESEKKFWHKSFENEWKSGRISVGVAAAESAYKLGMDADDALKSALANGMHKESAQHFKTMYEHLEGKAAVAADKAELASYMAANKHWPDGRTIARAGDKVFLPGAGIFGMAVSTTGIVQSSGKTILVTSAGSNMYGKKVPFNSSWNLVGDQKIKEMQDAKNAANAAKPKWTPPKPAAASHAVAQVSIVALKGQKVGAQTGSNPGGTYIGADGVKRYVKDYDSPTQAHGEAVANNVYRALGIAAPKPTLATRAGGGVTFASDYLPGAPTVFSDLLPSGKAHYAKEVLNGYAADVLLANWDTAGLTLDNLVVSDGAVHRIDNGGALLKRAQGADKPASVMTEIAEMDGFMNPNINASYAKIAGFAGVSKAAHIPGIHDQITAIGKLVAGGVDKLVPSIAGVPEADRQKTITMITNRAALLKKWSAANQPV